MKVCFFRNYGKNLPSINIHAIAQILRKTGRKAWASTFPPAKKFLSVTLRAIYTSKLTKKPGLFRKQAASNATLLLCWKSHLKLTGGVSRSCSQNPWLLVKGVHSSAKIHSVNCPFLSLDSSKSTVLQKWLSSMLFDLQCTFSSPILTSRSAFISLSESIRLW